MNFSKFFRSKANSPRRESYESGDELTAFVKGQFRELSKKNLTIPVKLYNL